jgi:hypothetical protein
MKKSPKTQSFNRSRKEAYAKMASDGNKENRNRLLSDALGNNMTQMDASRESSRSGTMMLRILERRKEKAVAAAKSLEQKAAAAKKFNDEINQVKANMPAAAPVIRNAAVGGTDTTANRRANRGGGAIRESRVNLTAGRHPNGACNNAGCFRCFPALNDKVLGNGLLRSVHRDNLVKAAAAKVRQQAELAARFA